MEILAIIPARGGSKGIPRKNIRVLAGKPLIAYTIEAARQTHHVKRVVVSTDDHEIANVAKQYHAEVIWRPAEISGDTDTSESALLHVLNYMKDLEKYEPDLVVFLQATSPLRRFDDIQKAIDEIQRKEADSLLSVCSLHGFLWRVEDDDRVSSFNYDYKYRQRRQDAPKDVVENGSIYIFKPWILRQFNNRLGGKIAIYEMDWLNSFDINEPSDLYLIESLLNIHHYKPENQSVESER